MNRERTFEIEATTANPAVASSADLDSHLARARRLRPEATAAALAGALRRIDRSARALVAGLARWHEQRQTRDALMRCSDRVLADIGIEREHIPLIAKGMDPAEYQLWEPATPALVGRRTHPPGRTAPGAARAPAAIPGARCLQRSRARRDRAPARGHPRHRARRAGAASGRVTMLGHGYCARAAAAAAALHAAARQEQTAWRRAASSADFGPVSATGQGPLAAPGLRGPPDRPGQRA